MVKCSELLSLVAHEKENLFDQSYMCINGNVTEKYIEHRIW